RFAIGWPCKSDGIEHVAFGSKTKVLVFVVGRVGVVERPRRHFCGPLAINSPGASTVDRLSIHIEPGTHFEKDLLNFVWYGAVGPWADVQEQVAVLADDVNELVKHEFRRLVSLVLDVTPGLVADRSVGLPVERANITQLSAFEVEHAALLLQRIILVVDHPNVVAIFQRTVVVERGKAREIRAD